MNNIDNIAITSQLSKIIESDEFRKKPLMSKFLAYLVDKYLEGKGDELKGYTIAVELFGKDDHFDPDQNALIRINAGRLRRCLKMYYFNEGHDDDIIIEVPKGQYSPRISTRQDIASENKAATPEQPSSNEIGIAVLPFKNYAKDAELEYFSIGLSRELSDYLTKFDELKVIGVFQEIEMSEIGIMQLEKFPQYNIDFVVTGDLFLAGDKLRINFRLVFLPEYTSIWADEIIIDKNEADLFEIQERITREIITQIGGEMGRINKFRFQKLLDSKPVTYDEQSLLLRHYHAQMTLSANVLGELLEIASRVVERDPSSALANALLAGINSSIYAQDIPGSEEAFVKCGEFAERAFELNPNHKIVLTTLAGKCFYYNERERLFNLYEDCKNWMPATPMGIGVFGLWLSLYGEWELGKSIIDEIFQNNMFVPTWYHGIRSFYYYRLNDFQNALNEANQFDLKSHYMSYVHRIAPLGQLGRLEEAHLEYEELLRIRPDFVERGRYLLHIHIKDKSLLNHILEGFEKIGVQIK